MATRRQFIRCANEFDVDDPSQDLLVAGNYPGTGTGIDGAPILAMVEQLRQGRLEPGRMYTATIMIPQCELDSNPALISSVGLLIDQLQGDVDRGDVVWATLTEMVKVWRSDYESRPLIAHL